jgi:hypothetical protein
LDTKVKRYFENIISLANRTFDKVEYNLDSTPERAILKLQAAYGKLRVFVTELFSDNARKYRYYILHGDWIIAGFDNSPDPRVIRKKYGKIGKEHVGEFVPHLQNKTILSLTEEMDFQAFVRWLEENKELIRNID